MTLPMLAEPIVRNEVQSEPDPVVEGKISPSDCGCNIACIGACVLGNCIGQCI